MLMTELLCRIKLRWLDFHLFLSWSKSSTSKIIGGESALTPRYEHNSGEEGIHLLRITEKMVLSNTLS